MFEILFKFKLSFNWNFIEISIKITLKFHVCQKCYEISCLGSFWCCRLVEFLVFTSIQQKKGDAFNLEDRVDFNVICGWPLRNSPSGIKSCSVKISLIKKMSFWENISAGLGIYMEIFDPTGSQQCQTFWWLQTFKNNAASRASVEPYLPVQWLGNSEVKIVYHVDYFVDFIPRSGIIL